MALSVPAGIAEEVAAGFRRFRDPLPEHATEITGLIADLYTISSSLKTLEDLSTDRRYRLNLPFARPDLDLASASLQYTLEDIVDYFGRLEGRRATSRSAHKKVWADMGKFFMAESEESLAIRLAKYKVFLIELEDYIKENNPDHGHMSRLREAFKELLVQQDSRLAVRMGAMSISSPSSLSSDSTAPSSPVSDRKPRTRRSYERPRPPHLSPQSPTSASSGSFFEIPPLAPDAPGSPVTSSATSHSLGSGTLSDHWASRVFFGPRTATRIPNRGLDSICYGDAQTGLKPWLVDQGFEEILQLAFPGTASGPDFRVFFYLREHDHRSRVVCKAAKRGEPSEYFCLPLNMLEIVRHQSSCLQLCRRRAKGKELVVWANLKFSTIEDMVLFYCTFLALRSQDSGRPVDRIRDYELNHEEELFGSPILDDDFVHALRVYRDGVTGAVRLQASVHRGEMKRSPVWTAFITDHIRSRGWVRLVEPKVVLLRDLHQTIFTFPEYNPPKTQRGGHLLNFTNRTDAEAFISTIAELATEGNSI
ncbi:uncharacterized protein BJX67DRAFT_114289 [Aspergillus lucknowensis]|uniref:Uncharacterized protein n=1 Tax=Aspergillus lucknowensis TaxID=176173 RepID=A0ABR4LRE7_9EURO